MNTKSTLLLAIAAAGLTAAGASIAGDRASRDCAGGGQARLSEQQAVVIAEVLGQGSARKVEWKRRSGMYEIALTGADGRKREVSVEAYGGRFDVDEDGGR